MKKNWKEKTEKKTKRKNKNRTFPKIAKIDIKIKVGEKSGLFF